MVHCYTMVTNIKLIGNTWEFDLTLFFITSWRFSNLYFILFSPGEGFNVNIPWNKDMMGDAEYKMAFDRIILPIANQYKPDLILVAAGFDAAAADPLGDYVVTPDMYAYMVERLLPLVSQRMGLILEGGYSPVAIGEALSGCLEVMLGIKSVNLEVGEPCKRALQTISSVILSQSKHWNL